MIADIDILFITHERPVYTRRALDRLLTTCDDRMRVWLWHNGLHAETLALVSGYASHPRVHAFHHCKENRKLDEPTRWMWAESRGDYLSKVDDDCLMPDGWADALRSAHEAEPDFGVLGCWRFQDEDFIPELAETKLNTYGRHCVLENCWVEGSGYLMKRSCIEAAGTLRPGEGFTRYCQRVAAEGWINGWLYPFLRQEHMDDPRAPHSLLKTDADLLAHAPLSARHRGIDSLEGWIAQLRESARIVQEAPTDPRQYVGVRKRVRRTIARLRGEKLVY